MGDVSVWTDSDVRVALGEMMVVVIMLVLWTTETTRERGFELGRKKGRM